MSESLKLFQINDYVQNGMQDFYKLLKIDLYLKFLRNLYNCFSNRFVSFYETATADAVLGYLIAFLVLLATIKLWHLLRLNPKLHMITSTLQRAWTDISGFIVVMTIMFLAYSIAVSIILPYNLWNLDNDQGQQQRV